MEHNEELELEPKITGIIRRNIMDRSVRVKLVQALIHSYQRKMGMSPNASQLERMADYILQEEHKAPHSYKMSYHEQPFMGGGPYQYGHQKLSSFHIAEEHGFAGIPYSTPKRRQLTRQEGIFFDEQTKIRNEERALQYSRDIEPGPVITYYLRDTGGVMTERFLSCKILRNK